MELRTILIVAVVFIGECPLVMSPWLEGYLGKGATEHVRHSS